MLAFRIADRRHPIFDSTGAFLKGGRWNSPGRRVIYAAQTYAGAMLEILVHAGISTLPRTHASIRIQIPETVAVEALTPEALPGWNLPDLLASRAFGDQWLSEQRTAIILVPSVILAGHESNVLLNPDHPQFRLIRASPPQSVLWDPRLSSPQM
jgi:RES domain-containing protein